MLIDLAWLYLVAVLAALEDVTRLQLADARRGLTQSVVGSEQDRREKEQLARQLTELFSRVDPSMRRRHPNVLPEYFEDLVDLVARASRRRSQINGALRVLEFTGVETVAGDGASWREAFPTTDVREPKLASDVIRFIVRAAHLSPEFVDRFDQAIDAQSDDPVNAGDGGSETEKASDTDAQAAGPEIGQASLFGPTDGSTTHTS